MEQEITIRQAAAKAGMGYAAMRKLCLDNHIARRRGGPDDHPYLKVLWSDVERAMSRPYVPPVAERPAEKRRGRRPVVSEAVRKLVRC
jgi:hypothetical protein